MIIRDFNKNDREDFFNMSREFYGGDSVMEAIPEENREKAFCEILSGSGLIRGLIIENDGSVAGYGLLTYFYSCEAGGRVVLIDEIFIKSQYRGKGLGTAYLNFVFEQYKGCRFRLEVMPKKAGAIRLYERMGFERIEYLQYIK